MKMCSPPVECKRVGLGSKILVRRATQPRPRENVYTTRPEAPAMRLVLAWLAASVLLTPAQAQLAPPNAAGVSMGQVHLNVKDIEAQRTFWTTQFGAHSLKREGLQGVMMPGMLILFSKRDYSGGSEGTMMDHFGLKVPSLSAALKRVRD